jgi:hypothetical protein
VSTRAWALALVLSTGGASLTAQTPTIALWPVGLDREIGGAPGAPERFDSLITARLNAAGLTVIPAAETRAIFNRLRDSIGGFYNTYTGRVIQDKLASVTRGTRRELSTRFGATVGLHASVIVWGIPFGGGTARWHGTSESSRGRGGLAGFLIGRSEGQVPALSLAVFAQDTAGHALYEGVGGIQLLGKIIDGNVRRVAPESLFADTARNTAAVRMAVDSLPAALASKKAPK